MELPPMLVFLSVVAVQLMVMTGTLAGALLVTGEKIDRATLPKCLLVTAVAVALAIATIPLFEFLASLVWFAALVGVFRKSVAEALAITVVCIVIGLGVTMAASTFIGLSS